MGTEWSTILPKSLQARIKPQTDVEKGSSHSETSLVNRMRGKRGRVIWLYPCPDSTDLRSAPKSIEHVEENKTREGHGGVSWCDLVILHLSVQNTTLLPTFRNLLGNNFKKKRRKKMNMKTSKIYVATENNRAELAECLRLASINTNTIQLSWLNVYTLQASTRTQYS